MDIRNILVNFDIDAFSVELATFAADLARRFDAEVIGVSAAEPPLLSAGAGDPMTASVVYAEHREEIERRLQSASHAFKDAMSSTGKFRWSGAVSDTTQTVISLARQADLVVTGSSLSPKDRFLPALDVGNLVLAAGRPVLLVGAGNQPLVADKIVVGWKDTRESRRAIADAMPFLKAAREVVVAVVDEGDYSEEKQGLIDVLAWLKSHRIHARGDVFPNLRGLSVTLDEVRAEIGADLVVTGAYGHSRLHEWFFGGMTHDLLAAPSLNRLMSS